MKASFCTEGGGHVENAQHLFLSCGIFGSYGIRFVHGLAFLDWILRLSQIISFSSSTLQIVLKHDSRFFS